VLSDPRGWPVDRLGVVDAGVVLPALLVPLLPVVGLELPPVLLQPADVPAPLDAGRVLPAVDPPPVTCAGDPLGVGGLLVVRIGLGVLLMPAFMVPVLGRRAAFIPPVPPFAYPPFG
jgi:hypothetical protein